MTRKEPELQIKTTLAKFAGFLKGLALCISLCGVGAGGTVAYNKLGEEPVIEQQYSESHCSLEIERKLNEYNARLTKVETRMDNTDLNIVEIKASLVRIETFLIYSKNENK